MLADIDKDTVDFVPNYDDDEQEPVVLPTRMPNLLVNGSAGIAVGMATNIPPHNLTEVVDGAGGADRRSPRRPIEQLMKIITGPDFPTARLHLRHRRESARRTRPGAAPSRCAPRPTPRRCGAAARRSSSPSCRTR